MDIKPFNEIMKDLNSAGTSDGQVEQLAQRLHEQGIANSMMEAREKARSMLKTEKEVTTDMDVKKENLTMYNDPRNNPNYNKYKAAMVEEMRQRAMGKREAVKIQDEFQTPGFEQKNGSAGLPRAVIREGLPTANPQRHIVKDRNVIHEEKVAPEQSATPEEAMTSPEPGPTHNPNPEPIPAKEPALKPKVEEPERPNKKENPKVDLGSVFNFSKR